MSEEKKVYVPKGGERVRVTWRSETSLLPRDAVGREFVVRSARTCDQHGELVLTTACGLFGRCLVEPLPPSETPAQETRPPCDACGAESCDSEYGDKVGNRTGWHLCAACWLLPIHDLKMKGETFQSRRAAIAEKKAFEVGDWVSGTNAARWLDNGVRDAEISGEITGFGGKDAGRWDGFPIVRSNYLHPDSLRLESPPASPSTPEAKPPNPFPCPTCKGPTLIGDEFCGGLTCGGHGKPPSPEAPKKRDPYAVHRQRLAENFGYSHAPEPVSFERFLSRRQAEDDDRRLAAMSAKERRQRQALEQLKSPLPKRSTVLVGSSSDWRGRRVPGTAPPAFPEDASLDAEWLP